MARGGAAARARAGGPAVRLPEHGRQVDGRAAIEGRSHALGSDADTLLLTELRALADAVLIGSGTLRAEGYGRLVGNAERVARRVAAGRAETPVAVLICRSLDLPWDAGLFAAADQPVLVYTRADAPRRPTSPRRSRSCGWPTPRRPPSLADLRARGIRALLCEGGPTLNRALLAAGRRRRAVPHALARCWPGTAGARGSSRGRTCRTRCGSRSGGCLHHEDELYLRYGVEP